eukprot:TRINITY_DN11982_c0_g1_i12.p7 TRINITY_DN11982_c0_g1~~TRINITY_DN11982_c0_g1_i12.p7  ORF type:complete len:191 (+),score=-20.71 TRINITY_DN11982_c0_g1_i12:357-929(+)
MYSMHSPFLIVVNSFVEYMILKTIQILQIVFLYCFRHIQIILVLVKFNVFNFAREILCIFFNTQCIYQKICSCTNKQIKGVDVGFTLGILITFKTICIGSNQYYERRYKKLDIVISYIHFCFKNTQDFSFVHLCFFNLTFLTHFAALKLVIYLHFFGRLNSFNNHVISVFYYKGIIYVCMYVGQIYYKGR